jgi:protein-disulfide isomerase
VVITEFMDFECPFCARLVPRLDTIMAAFPGEIAIVMHHFPLVNHPSALPAAIASECALRQGSFEAFYRAVFADYAALALGRRNLASYAEEAGVPNAVELARCASLPVDSFPRIEYGRALGDRSGVRATPTVWINGRPLRGATLAGIRARVEQELR